MFLKYLKLKMLNFLKLKAKKNAINVCIMQHLAKYSSFLYFINAKRKNYNTSMLKV